jgi:hypothetical protein
VKLPVAAGILKQALPRRVAAAAHDAGEPRIVETHVVQLAALALEVELDLAAPDRGVSIAQRRQSIRAVLLGTAVVADAHAGALHQLDHRRQHLALFEPGAAQVARERAVSQQELGLGRPRARAAARPWLRRSSLQRARPLHAPGAAGISQPAPAAAR